MAIKNKSSRRRRGNGEGTIYKRGSKWCAQIYLNKKRRSVTLETRKEAQEWLHMMRNKMLQGIQHNSEMIFGEISNRWLQSKELSVSGKTYLQY